MKIINKIKEYLSRSKDVEYKAIDVCPFCGVHNTASWRGLPLYPLMVKCKICGIHYEEDIFELNRKLFPKYLDLKTWKIMDAEYRFTGLPFEQYIHGIAPHVSIQNRIDKCRTKD